jgi:hypothetical protein
MDDLEKIGNESIYVENKAMSLQVLENLDMYTDGIFEMAHFQSRDSGLQHSLWFDEVNQYRTNKINTPRVKIGLDNGNLIPVSIEEQPGILLKGIQLAKAEDELKGKPKEEMFNFISKNREVILQHWNGEIDSIDLFSKLLKN